MANKKCGRCKDEKYILPIGADAGNEREYIPCPDCNGTGESKEGLTAKRFHELYEELAPKYGYETRKESAKPWSEVPEKNKALMTEVCNTVKNEIELAVKDRIRAKVHKKMAKYLNATLKEIEITKAIDEA